jgi:hypothetical protein
MASTRRAFTDEFKAEAVRLVTVEGHSARQVARDLGIHEMDPGWGRFGIHVKSGHKPKPG